MLQLIKLTVTVVHCSNVEKEPLKLLRAFWFFLTRRAELGSETDVRCHPPETETSCYVWRPSRDRDDVVETETTTPSAIHRQIFQCEAVYLQRVLSNMQRGVCCSCARGLSGPLKGRSVARPYFSGGTGLVSIGIVR